MSDFSICPDPDRREALHDDGFCDYRVALVSVLRPGLHSGLNIRLQKPANLDLKNEKQLWQLVLK